MEPMSLRVERTVCDHEWEIVDDPAAYRDGFSIPSGLLCKHCHTWKRIEHSNPIEWNYILLFPFIMVAMFVLAVIAETAIILTLIVGGLGELFSSLLDSVRH
jgi:hypothetical protein